LKREIYELTAQWRGTEAGNRILRFEPASSEASIHFNPLDEIRIGTEHETGDIQNLANLIVDPDGKGLQTHWQKTACSLLAGCIAHVLYRAKREKTPATLPAVDRLLSDPDKKPSTCGWRCFVICMRAVKRTRWLQAPRAIN
jgi:type IV secretion system protein VirD4